VTDAAAGGGRALAVLFDMDGLLLDSEPLWTVAEVDLAARLGGSWSDELKAAIIGTRLDVAVPAILEWYGVTADDETVADAMAFLLHRMTELFTERVPVMPGAVELLDGVRRLGARTALVSSSYRVLVDAATALLGPERFDATLAGDEVGHGKPDPEPYTTVCSTLGVPPGRAVVVEDAPSGVASGEAAGCVVVAVPSLAAITPTPRRPVVSSLADVDPAWLLSLPSLLSVPSVG
jgi:HAD superfamily hydrolase (TIGR01509 family)